MDFTSLTCCPLSSPTICGFQRSGIFENFSAILTLSIITSAGDFRSMRTLFDHFPGAEVAGNICDELTRNRKAASFRQRPFLPLETRLGRDSALLAAGDGASPVSTEATTPALPGSGVHHAASLARRVGCSP